MTARHVRPPSLRDWAFEAYARPGVEECCLELQDRHAMDVVAVLWCIWAGAHHGAIDAETVDGMVVDSTAWQAEVVVPLRTVRRRLGETADLPGDGPGAASAVGASPDSDRTARDGLRRRVADAELAAEEIQLARLEASTVAALRSSSPTDVPGAAAVRTNLARLVAASGRRPDPDREAAIDALLRRVEELAV